MLHASTLSPNHHGERWNGRCAADKGVKDGVEKRRREVRKKMISRPSKE